MCGSRLPKSENKMSWTRFPRKTCPEPKKRRPSASAPSQAGAPGGILYGVRDFVGLDEVLPALHVDAGILGAFDPIPFDQVMGDLRRIGVPFARQHDPIVVKVVEVIVRDFIVAAVQVHSVTLTKQSDVIRDFKPRHADEVCGYRKPLRHGPAARLKGDEMLGRTGAFYVRAFRVNSFRNQNRIPWMRGVGSLLNGSPRGCCASGTRIIPFSGINVERVCERRGSK